MTVQDIFETMEYGPAPEDAKPAYDWLERHKRKFGHFIGGDWTSSGKGFPSKNHATGETLAMISQASAKDIDQTVRASSRPSPA